MDKKRCVYCNRLADADAEICTRCGHAFTERTSRVSIKSRQPSRNLIKRTIPPASPHRAGHYSGLHPEDQPFQTSTLALQPHVLRKSMPSQPDHLEPVEPEPDIIYLAPPTRKEQEVIKEQDPDSMLEVEDYPSEPMLDAGLEVPSYFPGKPRLRSSRRRIVPSLLIIISLLLLIGGSSLAYIYLNRGTPSTPALATASLTANPSQLRVNDTFSLTGNGFPTNQTLNFTHDANIAILDGNGKRLSAKTDDAGHFSLQVTVPPSWNVGSHLIHVLDTAAHQITSVTITVQAAPQAPPHLQLGETHIDLGTEVPGVISSTNVTLINTGGGQVTWQASSDQPWLTVSPNSNTFSGSAAVAITANRGILAPQSYSGNITFTQQGSDSQPLILSVAMAVKAAPASLSILSGPLTYSASATQNPPDQLITLKNSGGEPVDWSSSASTGDGNPWLSVVPASGHLEPQASAELAVHVQSLNLATGSYRGTVTFNGGANPQLAVTLTVVAAGELVISPPSLNFAMTQGQNPATQTITVQNSGGLPVDWTASPTTADGANWLSLTPLSGHLEAGAKVTITVTISGAALSPNAYQGVITFNYGAQNKQATVSLTVSPPPAVISISPNTLNFVSLKGTNPQAQAFTITNMGGSVLNWFIIKDQFGAIYVPVTPASGSLQPSQSVTVTVAPNVSSILGTGSFTLSTDFVVADSDTGTPVQNQTLTANITLNDQAVIKVSATSLSFTNTVLNYTSSQSLVITNTGTSILNWTIRSSSGSISWLSIDVTSGSLNPGASITIHLNTNSSQLFLGTYTATLVVSDTDSGSPVQSQAIKITLTMNAF